MTEEIKKIEDNKTETKPSFNKASEDKGGERRAGGGRRGGAGRGNRRGPRQEERVPDEFEQKIVDIARVTRVMAGGKRMRFRACVAIGNRKGKVAIGLAKGADVTLAVAKAVNQAKKDLVMVPIYKQTIPHAIEQKFGAARVLLKPAAAGRGIIAGGIVRTILELSGINNISSKVLGTNNKVNNAKCVILALKNLRTKKLSNPQTAPKIKEEVSEQ